MNRRTSFLSISVTLVLLASITLVAQEGAAVKEFRLTAKRYEFTPDEIRVRQGATVRLVITALDHEHGIEIKAFQVKQKLPKGETTTVQFVASEKGTFEFHCSEFCGLGHRRMKGKITVE
jgi:cytochrome c oxidase subunit 2